MIVLLLAAFACAENFTVSVSGQDVRVRFGWSATGEPARAVEVTRQGWRAASAVQTGTMIWYARETNTLREASADVRGGEREIVVSDNDPWIILDARNVSAVVTAAVHMGRDIVEVSSPAGTWLAVKRPARSRVVVRSLARVVIPGNSSNEEGR